MRTISGVSWNEISVGGCKILRAGHEALRSKIYKMWGKNDQTLSVVYLTLEGESTSLDLKIPQATFEWVVLRFHGCEQLLIRMTKQFGRTISSYVLSGINFCGRRATIIIMKIKGSVKLYKQGHNSNIC
jgi:hypothetical protein